MASKVILGVVLLWISSVQAVDVTPTVTHSYTNSSSTISSTSSAITQKCCFVVQDTISQEWWEQTRYSYVNVSLTSYTTYITKWPNGTQASTDTNVYPTVRTFSSTIGGNPIENYQNSAPGPEEATKVLTTTGAHTIGGVVIQSPAAYYVYNSVKIITVAAVTNERGDVQCGVDTIVTPGLIFTNVNDNVQAYFGGYGIVGRTNVPTLTNVITTTKVFEDVIAVSTGGESTITQTTTITYNSPQDRYLYTNSADETVTNSNKPTGTVISLVTPFIYAPQRGATGGLQHFDHCQKPGGTENYGYIPQTLLDYLIEHKEYSSQYPGLEDCAAGGPSVIPGYDCGFFETTQKPLGGDLTEDKTVYVTPPGISKPDPTGPAHIAPGKPPGKPDEGGNKTPPQGKPADEKPPGKKPDEIGNKTPPKGKPADPPKGGSGTNEGPVSQINGGNQGGGNQKPTGPAAPGETSPPGRQPDGPPKGSKPDPHLGGIINSIMGGKPAEAEPTAAPVPPGNPIVIPAKTQIPVDKAPPGLTGEVKTVNGKPVIVVPGPTTIAAPAALPSGAEGLGSKTMIGGSPYIVIPGPTNIPQSELPAGFGGHTTTIGGVPYVSIPGPMTFAVPQPGSRPDAIGSSTLINGVPFVVYPGPTSIPVANAPQGLSGSTTMVNGVPYLVISSPTTIAAPGGADSIDSTTLIGGVPFVIYPGPTSIPLSKAPPGLSGTTTKIDGVPYLVIPSPTTVAVQGGAGSLGRTTLISGTPYVVIPGPTSIPASGAPKDIKGAKTTMVNGTPYLVIPSQTTVALSPSKTSDLSGQLTVIIDGSSRLVIAGPTTMPVNPKFPISGKTTIIDGKTMVIVTAPTTVAAKKTTSKTSSRTASITTTSTSGSQVISTPSPTRSGGNPRMGLNACVLALAVGGTAFVLFA